MIFRYHQVIRGDEDRYLPLVPLTIHGPSGSLALTALIDSGSEHNVLRSEIAAELGVHLDDERPVMLMGYDGKPAPAHMVPIEFQLARHRWAAPVIFTAAITRRGLLGQIGFFAFFTVTFKYQQRIMEIRRAR